MDYNKELLQPVSDEAVCGLNLEDDAEFQNFFFVAQGVPERFDGENTLPAEAPDWRSIEKQAMAFVARTKNLKLMSILAQSLVSTKGLAPFAQCLQAISTLLQEQWENVYPLLDEDDGDPLERIASLSHLNDSFVVSGLRSVTLASLKGVGNITLTEIEKSEAGSEDSNLSISQIKGVFSEINAEEVQLLHMSLAYSLESIENINECLTEKAGHEYSVDLHKVTSVLKDIKSALEKYASLEEVEGCDTNVGMGNKPNKSSAEQTISDEPSIRGNNFAPIRSREDVERCLDLINEYYSSFEPSSPIPVLVNRAKKLVHKGFLAIVQDIYPDALDAVHQLGGINPDEDNEENDDEW